MKEKKGETKKEKESKQPFKDNQIKWVFGVMIVLIVGVFVFSWFSTESAKFDYAGMTFETQRVGNIPIYTTFITGFDQNGIPIEYRINLRNDPRTLEVPIEGEINFLANQPVFFSLDLDSGINECRDLLPIVDFSRFMYAIGFELISAVTTEELSQTYNRPHADCSNRPGNTVLILQTGDETKIVQDDENPNCYYLQFSNCEDVEVLEKFEISTLERFSSRG